MGGDVVSIFAMSEWPVGDDGAMCVLTKSFLWDSTKESFCRFFWAKRKQPIVLYCIGSKRRWRNWMDFDMEKINRLKEMEKLDGF
jgi:hypothetical protein